MVVTDLRLLLIAEYWDEYARSHQLFKSYFLGDKKFLTSNDKMSIADVVAVTTFEHAKNVDRDFIDDDEQTVEYIDRCRALLPDYDVIHEEVRSLKERMRSMNML